jgi:hypothetical protein
LGKKAVYVGIPSTTVLDRENLLTDLINNTSLNTKAGRKKRARAAIAAAAVQMNNAELLYVFSKGSPVSGQPPRPVIEPAIVAPGNKESISHELAEATKAQLNGNSAEANKRLKRAGIAGENASKAWFTDSRNGWAPNAQTTIDQKGSDRPGIDFGLMRNAITSVVKDEP